MKQLQLFLMVPFLLLFSCQNTIDNDIPAELNGQYIEKTKDGIITVVGNFQNGKREGQFMYLDAKGKLETQENYVNNELHGTQLTIHNTGKINNTASNIFKNQRGQNIIKFFKNIMHTKSIVLT